MIRSWCASFGALLLLTSAANTTSAPEPKPQPTQAEASNLALVGYNDLQGRSAYQPLVHFQNGRWIAYVGHHGGSDTIPKPRNPMTGKDEFNGTSILDVTDPHNPKYLAHIPGQVGLTDNGGSQMVRVCDGKELPKGDAKAVYLLRPFGSEAQEIWNTADPTHPVLVTRVETGLTSTHKNWWECDTGIGYLISSAPGWRVRQILKVYDLSDPAHPVFIRDFGLNGQQPGATGPTLRHLHGVISLGPKVNRVYFAYGVGSEGVLQIIDRDKLINGPKEPTPENLRYPEVGRLDMPSFWGGHTAFPMLDMAVPEFANDKLGKTHNFVVFTGEEGTNECQSPRQIAWIIDITQEAHPVPVSTYGAEEASGHFCSRGGRFGMHATNENMTPIYYKKIVFFSSFNAGVRAVDMRDPLHPKEIGYYIPAVTERADKRCVKVEGGPDRCKFVVQTNNVDVDDRGYIYITDRANNGLHILEPTGAVRALADMPKQ